MSRYFVVKSFVKINCAPGSRLPTCHKRCMGTQSQDDYQYLQKSQTPTLHFQPSLPRLPIPELQKTTKRYLDSLETLVPSDQHSKTSQLMASFVANEGKALHEELVATDKNNKHTSYISAPWFDMYLRARDPIVLNYNPCIGFIDDPKLEYNNQVIRASNMVISALRFMRSLRAQTLDPEVYHLNPAKSDNDTFRLVTRLLPSSVSWYGAYMYNAYPLDMSQYSNLFNSTRIPEIGKDRLVKDETVRHVLVMRNGNFYVFDVLDEQGNILPPEHIHACIKHIAATQDKPNEAPIGYLTSEERNTWAKARDALLKAGNEEALRKVDYALFALLLDDEVSKEEPITLTRQMLYGNGANRWLDKSFQLIVAKDGKAALNFEHSWGDGVAVLRFFNEIYKDSTSKPRVHPTSTTKIDPAAHVRRLEFRTNEGIQNFVNSAKEKFNKVTSGLEINILQSNAVEKEFLKKQKVSPDAVMQLSFQMGFYRQYGKTVASYESCSTAAFRHGRTETIRPATKATKVCSEAFSTKNRPDDATLRKMVEDCSKMHFKLTKNAAMGQGFDRHLFALRYLAEQKGMKKPAVYTDPSYELINRNILSTSTLSSPHALLGGFGPVVSDGFGIGYVITDEMAGCIITSYPPNRDGAGFAECVQSSLKDIKEVLGKTTPTENK